MRKVSGAVLAAAVLGCPFAAQAGDFSYTYVDVAYVNTDPDGIGEDLDGLALRGSLGITDDVFIFASYADQGADFGPFDIDLETYELGGGYAWHVSPTLDVYGKISYVSAEASGGGFSADDDGFGLAAGMRGWVMDKLELEGALRYVDLSDSGDDTTFVAAGRYHFTEAFAAGLEAEIGDDATTYGIGVRFSF